jgi:hypothetical protein
MDRDGRVQCMLRPAVFQRMVHARAPGSRSLR